MAPLDRIGTDPVALVRSAVAQFIPVTPREIASRDRIITELDRLERPFDRHADPVHVTGSAIVAGPRGTVLHLHKRMGRWMQPGGHLEPGEMPWDAALRETEEETGLHPRPVTGAAELLHLDVHPASGHLHLDLRYLLGGDDRDPAPREGESAEARWFEWDEAISCADAALVHGLLRARSRLGRS